MKKTVICIAVILTAASVLTSCSKTDAAGKSVTGVRDERITAAQHEEKTEKKPSKVYKGANTGTSQTYTGLEPLECVPLDVADPRNTAGLSTKKICHSFGVPSDSKPNDISVNSQAYFDEHGFDALTLDTKSDKKVLYLTFDCGYENGYTAKILDVLKEKNVHAAFFCTLPEMRDNPEIIARAINEGHIVGNHTRTHRMMDELSRTDMAQDIKDFDDYIRTHFGYSAGYFRFPQGEYSDCALDLVQSMGYTSVFWSLAYEDWDLDNQKGADYALETVTQRLHPGAVILLHAVSPDNANALADIIDTAREQGYEFRALTEYEN